MFVMLVLPILDCGHLNFLDVLPSTMWTTNWSKLVMLFVQVYWKNCLGMVVISMILN
jgi:hypothetical protein